MVIKAVALERRKTQTIEVLSDAPGRAHRFFIRIGNWCRVEGAVRAEAITARVIEELRRLGVRAELVVVRCQYMPSVNDGLRMKEVS